MAGQWAGPVLKGPALKEAGPPPRCWRGRGLQVERGGATDSPPCGDWGTEKGALSGPMAGRTRGHHSPSRRPRTGSAPPPPSLRFAAPSSANGSAPHRPSPSILQWEPSAPHRPFDPPMGAHRPASPLRSANGSALCSTAPQPRGSRRPGSPPRGHAPLLLTPRGGRGETPPLPLPGYADCDVTAALIWCGRTKEVPAGAARWAPRFTELLSRLAPSGGSTGGFQSHPGRTASAQHHRCVTPATSTTAMPQHLTPLSP